jgi:hypothetical protein
MWIGWAAAAALVLTVSGCSSSASSPPNPQSAASATTAPAPRPTSTLGPLSAARARAALLVAGDIGAKFSQGTFTRNDRPLACAAAGTPSFRAQTSPRVEVGSNMISASLHASLDEQIFGYADAAAARRALALAKKGLDCIKGTTYSATGAKAAISIGTPADVSAALGVDSGFVWPVQNKASQGSAIAVVIGPVVVLFNFSTVVGADTTKLPSGLAVAKIAVAKLNS